MRHKAAKKRNWYKNGGSEAVFFVNATPNRSLAKACSNEFKKVGLKVKVVERTGTTIKKMLVKSNPFKEMSCKDPRCYVCSLGVGFSCKDRDVVYRMFCQGVNRVGQVCTNINYEGETSRSNGERFGEHMGVLASQCDSTRKKSVFFEHVMSEHGGYNPKIGHNETSNRSCVDNREQTSSKWEGRVDEWTKEKTPEEERIDETGAKYLMSGTSERRPLY